MMSLIGDAAKDHHLQVWMANPDEEAIMQELGISGALETDSTKPVLGVYINDRTWAKIGWYLDLRTTVDEGVQNDDGSVTYQAVTTVGNTITYEEVEVLPRLIHGTRGDMPVQGSMYSQLVLVAPAGGTISDVAISDESSTRQMQLYGFDTSISLFWTNPESTTTITYSVTTSPEAREPLAIRMSPTARTFE